MTTNDHELLLSTILFGLKAQTNRVHFTRVAAVPNQLLAGQLPNQRIVNLLVLAEYFQLAKLIVGVYPELNHHDTRPVG